MPTVICDVCGKPWMDTKYARCPTCASGGPRPRPSANDSPTRGGPGSRVPKDRARAIVATEYEFEVITRMSPSEVMSLTMDAALATGSPMRGSVQGLGAIACDGGLAQEFVVKGPGGFVILMNLTVIAQESADRQTRTSLEIGDFMFQKGGFGTRPSISGGSIVGKFVALLRAAVQP